MTFCGCVQIKCGRIILTNWGLQREKQLWRGWMPSELNKENIIAPQCNRNLLRYLKYNVAPPFIAFTISELKMRVDNQVALQELNQMYRLCGIIYYGNNHFISWIIDRSGRVWLHDSAERKEQVLYYDNIINFPYQKLQTVNNNYIMTLILYTKLWHAKVLSIFQSMVLMKYHSMYKSDNHKVTVMIMILELDPHYTHQSYCARPGHLLHK